MSHQDNQQQPGVAPGDWKRELTNLLQLKGRVSSGKRKPKPISDRTLDAREEILFMCMRQIREMGYGIKSVYSLRGKHVEALVEKWKADGVGAGAIQNRLSILRALSKWIGKDGMVLPTRHYSLESPERLKRKTVATTDKSWSAKGIDPAKIAALAAEIDPYVGMQLQVIEAFGIRREEAIQFRPNQCHEGDQLRIRNGTKGGRERMVPIESDKQRNVVAAAKKIVSRWDGAIAPPGKSLEQNLRRFKYVMDRIGITKKALGVTAHGLRHERLNDIFEEVAGTPSPVRQLTYASKNRITLSHIFKGNEQKWKEAQQKVSNIAGHRRISIAGAYTGSTTLPKQPRQPRLDWTAGKATGGTASTLVEVEVRLDHPGPTLDVLPTNPAPSIPDSAPSRAPLEDISVAFVGGERGGRGQEADPDDHAG